VGKRTFALRLAEALLCETNPPEMLDPCRKCPACLQVQAGTHPDVLKVCLPEDKTEIPVDLIIGDRQHRGREGLVHSIGLRPYSGRRKIAIIDDADHLNIEGANALLKALEEPPPKSILILVGTSAARQLPTIRSRCQLIRFEPLAPDVVARLLLEQGVTTDPNLAAQLAQACDGSPVHARELADPALWEFREVLVTMLSRSHPDAVRLATTVAEFVESAGKEAKPRRERLRTVLHFAADFYRQVLRAIGGAEIEATSTAPVVQEAVDRMVRQGQDPERIARKIERCLEGRSEVDSMAHLPTMIDAWAGDVVLGE